MEQLTKAQLTIGILSYFAIVWALFENLKKATSNSGITLAVLGVTIGALVVMIVLSFVILSILEWIKIFDLKTNSILTMMTITVFGISLLMITAP